MKQIDLGGAIMHTINHTMPLDKFEEMKWHLKEIKLVPTPAQQEESTRLVHYAVYLLHTLRIFGLLANHNPEIATLWNLPYI